MKEEGVLLRESCCPNRILRASLTDSSGSFYFLPTSESFRLIPYKIDLKGRVMLKSHDPLPMLSAFILSLALVFSSSRMAQTVSATPRVAKVADQISRSLSRTMAIVGPWTTMR